MRPTFNLVAIFALLVALTGCQMTPKRKAYTTLAGVSSAVDNAMNAAADAYVAELIDDEAWGRIANAHADYLPAFRAAVRLAQGDYNTWSPEKVTELANYLLSVVFTYVDQPQQ